jgi:hypothetical protein
MIICDKNVYFPSNKYRWSLVKTYFEVADLQFNLVSMIVFKYLYPNVLDLALKRNVSFIHPIRYYFEDDHNLSYYCHCLYSYFINSDYFRMHINKESIKILAKRITHLDIAKYLDLEERKTFLSQDKRSNKEQITRLINKLYPTDPLDSQMEKALKEYLDLTGIDLNPKKKSTLIIVLTMSTIKFELSDAPFILTKYDPYLSKKMTNEDINSYLPSYGHINSQKYLANLLNYKKK